MSRFVSAWLPRWPILRFLAAQARNPRARNSLSCERPIDPERPFVLAAEATGGPRIAAANAAAEALRINIGEGVSDARAKAMGVRPLARFVAYATAGCLPEEFGIGPVNAIPKALKLAGLTLDDISVIELNEAFAAQSLAVIKQAGLDASKVNPNGGAIALGHPLGCTGAKLTASILRELQRRDARYGIVTMCIGGGMGAAGIIERLS